MAFACLKTFPCHIPGVECDTVTQYDSQGPVQFGCGPFFPPVPNTIPSPPNWFHFSGSQYSLSVSIQSQFPKLTVCLCFYGGHCLECLSHHILPTEYCSGCRLQLISLFSELLGQVSSLKLVTSDLCSHGSHHLHSCFGVHCMSLCCLPNPRLALSEIHLHPII